MRERRFFIALFSSALSTLLASSAPAGLVVFGGACSSSGSSGPPAGDSGATAAADGTVNEGGTRAHEGGVNGDADSASDASVTADGSGDSASSDSSGADTGDAWDAALQIVPGAIAAGAAHTCAIAGGGVKCWGLNDYGQLGDGTTVDSLSPQAVVGLSGIVAIAAGYDHTCALTNGGAVTCWGDNYAGQLGNNSTLDSVTPVAVSTLSSGVVAIAAGAAHTCALLVGGIVICWGSNELGQLGNGSTMGASAPVSLAGPPASYASLAAGANHTCAILTGGGIRCWGDNSAGQLGNPLADASSSDSSSLPIDLLGLPGTATAITAGAQHTCVVLAGGGAACWGDNSSSQLGSSAAGSRSTVPVVVDSLAGASAIVAGAYHTCATVTGGVKCWGLNDTGELGNNGSTDSALPVNVSGLSLGIAAISAGYYHSCVLTGTGAAKCWGFNDSGQLGDQSTNDALVPVDVLGFP